MRWLAGLGSATTLLGQPDRLVHLGNCEDDIYEFFYSARELGTHFLLRTCVDRLAVGGNSTVGTGMTAVPVTGTYRIEVTAKDGGTSETEVELRYARIHALLPIGKRKQYPALNLTILHAREAMEPKGHARLD